MGWATEPGFLGDRDLSRAPALEAARDHAYGEAGITDPRKAFDVIEIADPTPYQSLIALDALGLSTRDEWAKDVAAGAFSAEGSFRFNPSGGARAANPVYCTGLRSIAEAADQVRGASKYQAGPVNMALAHGASGFAMQYQSVVVFGR
jgi:acetyl-CoA C-acetyltransferase